MKNDRAAQPLIAFWGRDAKVEIVRTKIWLTDFSVVFEQAGRSKSVHYLLGQRLVGLSGGVPSGIGRHRRAVHTHFFDFA